MVETIGKHACILLACMALAACLDDAPKTPGDGTDLPAANSAPQISGTPPTTAQVGQSYEFVPDASDPDGDALTFRIANRPQWATFNAITGKLAGTPPADASARYDDIRVSVTDGTSTVSLPRFSLTIEGTTVENSAPTITGTPAAAVTVGNAFSFTPQAADADGDTLTFSVSNKPGWLQFDAMTGRLNGTPTDADVGVDAGITITVSDGTVSTSLNSFSVEVKAGAPDPVVNTPPTITGVPALTIMAGQSYQFLPSANDADGQALQFSISGKPVWATFSSSTGRLSGTPSVAQVGQYSGITISVSDGVDTAALAAFTINVVPANSPPQISGAPPASVTAGELYTFQPSASDPDGQTLSFTISGKPAWASFNASTGRLSGTPTATQAGNYTNIVITVSDGTAQATLGPFAIEVLAANRAPTIGGSPPSTVTAGDLYDFTPTASDPDGDTLTYSITNKPSWANFSPTTGRLYGTPVSGDVGNYASITIRVSDGQLSDTLAAFAITVEDVQLGSATLHWSPPTTNEDGSPLTNLQGYRIHYGTSSSNLDSQLEIPDPGITSATVEALTPATWYFAVKSYTSDGTESSFSNIASKTIN